MAHQSQSLWLSRWHHKEKNNCSQLCLLGSQWGRAPGLHETEAPPVHGPFPGQSNLSEWNERTVLTLGFLQKITSGPKYQDGNYHSNDKYCNKSFYPWGKKDWKRRKKIHTHTQTQTQVFPLPARNNTRFKQQIRLIFIVLVTSILLLKDTVHSWCRTVLVCFLFVYYSISLKDHWAEVDSFLGSIQPFSFARRAPSTDLCGLPYVPSAWPNPLGHR